LASDSAIFEASVDFIEFGNVKLSSLKIIRCKSCPRFVATARRKLGLVQSKATAPAGTVFENQPASAGRGSHLDENDPTSKK